VRPLDPRLLRYASAARSFLICGAVLGLLQTLTIISFAFFLSQSIVGALERVPVGELSSLILGLAVTIVVRMLLIWLLEVAASRGAAHVKSQLRNKVLRALAARGPDWVAGQQGARLSTIVTSGLDALDNYFARYLPQLLLTLIATPILVGVMLWKIFGRENRQGARLRSITEDYRTRTMKVLRVSFLSGFVLELAASLSVALIAVSVGLRLVEGDLALSVGLFVLLLAPEAFLPLRQVGAQFHAAADGLAAAEEVFAILDGQQDLPTAAPSGPVETPSVRESRSCARTPANSSTLTPANSSARTPPDAALRLAAVSVAREQTDASPPVDAEFRPGELSVISGPSGVGKSSLVSALQGFVLFEGAITLGDVPVAAHDPRDWLAWAGQRPGLFAGTIESNVTLGEASVDPDVEAVALALDWAGAPELDPMTSLGVNGAGLSGGQAQRVAVARAIYRARRRGCHVVICDEPSSALDAVAEAALLVGLRRLTAEGRIVIVISHRPAFIAAADQVLELREASLV